ERARPVAVAGDSPRRGALAAVPRRRLQPAERGRYHQPEHDHPADEPERSGDSRQPALRRKRQPDCVAIVAEKCRVRCGQWLSGAALGPGAGAVFVLITVGAGARPAPASAPQGRLLPARRSAKRKGGWPPRLRQAQPEIARCVTETDVLDDGTEQSEVVG